MLTIVDFTHIYEFIARIIKPQVLLLFMHLSSQRSRGEFQVLPAYIYICILYKYTSCIDNYSCLLY